MNREVIERVWRYENGSNEEDTYKINKILGLMDKLGIWKLIIPIIIFLIVIMVSMKMSMLKSM